MEERYIKCFSSIIGSSVWHDDGVLKLYFYFLCKMSHKTKSWCGLVLNPGELPLSERNAAKELEWSRSKFLRKLEQLKNTGLISVQASEAGTLIRFVHWQEECGFKMIPGGIETRPRGIEKRTQDGQRLQNDTTVVSQPIPSDDQWCQSETAGGLKTRPNQYINKLYTHSLSEEPEGFSQLWLAYPSPRRTCKDEAIVLFQKAINEGATVDAMIAALEAEKSSYAWTKEGGRYIPGIVKWLQKETWHDYVVTAPTKEGKKWISR